MKHLGDITKINGAEIEPVDCICGGSPCQDLSLAGRRAGLGGERSGLFMEQIRIVKEMRNVRTVKGANVNIRPRPRYMVWENVPGAFSSNKGRDFQAVLTEIVRIVKTDAPDVPLLDKWSKSGCLMGYGDTGQPFSVAWRVHDAQFWGVPQRRKRIAVIADFGGLSAPEICFERKGVSGHFAEGREEGQGIAKTTETRADDANWGFYSFQEIGIYKASTKASAQKQRDYKGATDLVVTMNYRNAKEQTANGKLQVNEQKQDLNSNNTCPSGIIVRRLTPLEAERLQGFPDGWTDIGEWTDSKGKRHKLSDTPRYIALGNSIAIPFWFWLLRRISAQYERPATMGSLFDGIGGFPFCWEKCNGQGTARWASEIEDFPIAVTKAHFPEEK